MSHSAANGWVVGHLPKVKCLPPLIQQDNTTNHLTFEVRHWAAALYQLVVGCARAGFGWNQQSIHILWALHWVPDFVMGFTFSPTGRWLMHWAHSIVD